MFDTIKVNRLVTLSLKPQNYAAQVREKGKEWLHVGLGNGSIECNAQLSGFQSKQQYERRIVRLVETKGAPSYSFKSYHKKKQ